MKIVGYKQPQTVAAQKADDKPKDNADKSAKPANTDGNKLKDNAAPVTGGTK